MILNPNCSTQVFRLSGSLAEIKNEVLIMLDCVEKEYVDYDKTKKEKQKTRDMINKKRKEITAVKKLSDFRKIIFPFTCNYETYFQPTKEGGLRVATCNNHDWSDMTYIPEDEEKYYEVKKYDYYKLVVKGGKWIVADKEFNKQRIRLILRTKDGSDIELHDKYGDLKILKTGKTYEYLGDRVVKMVEVTDKKLLQEINDQLLLKDI